MAHVIVANLNEAQFTALQGSNIPYIEFPPALVPRFVALVQDGISIEDALIKLVKIAILNGEASAYAQFEGQALDARTRQRRMDLAAELGL